MPSAEVLTWVLSGCFVILSALFGVVWNLLRNEAKEHSRLIEMKASTERLSDLETRLAKDMQSADERWERLFDKQDAKHVRDNESIRNDFRDQLQQIREQIGRSEANILAQMKMLFTSNHKEN